MEDYQLPGGFHVNPTYKDTHLCKDTFPLAIVSSVLFPGHADTLLQNNRNTKDDTSNTLPGAWIEDQTQQEVDDETEPLLGGSEDPQDIDELRRTVAALREQAEKLQETDVLVKKSIQIVARKRLQAQHDRRRQSEWDWCGDEEADSSDSSDDDEDDGNDDRMDDWELI